MSQAYFSCEQSAYAEDYVHMIRSDGERQVQRIPQDTELEILADQVSNFPVYWRTLIFEYTKRAMTFEGDALNAVKGVMASYCRNIGETPVCGLPLTTLFEYGLMWIPTEPLRRRAADRTGMFPSWSWLGWVGAVHWEDIDDDKHIKEGRIIHRWSLQSCLDGGDPNKPIPVYVRNDRDKITFKTESDHSPDMSAISALQTGILHFSTLSLHCQVTRLIQVQLLYSEDPQSRHTGIYAIMHGNKQIGGIHLEHNVADTLVRDSREKHEFIALSAPIDSWYLHPRLSQADYDENDDLIPLFDSRLLDGEVSSDAVYNVMLITWEGGLAYRAGIGQIHKESFDAAGPMVRDIQLG